MALGDESCRAWGALKPVVRTGDIALDHLFGQCVWQGGVEHPGQ